MHDEFAAASRRVKVDVCGNTARILAVALSGWQAENRRKIEVAEQTKVAGWEYIVHRALADESVATAWLSEVNRFHARLAEHEKDDLSGGIFP